MPLSNFEGYDYRNLSKEESSPLISLRRDAATCSRIYSCDWIDAYSFANALRGICTVDGTIFSRQHPHNFLWDGAKYPFVCMDIPNIKPAGLLKEADGDFDVTELDDNPDLIVPADKAHMNVEYAAVRWPLADDDDTNEPVGAGDETAIDKEFNEWDRYCDWTREWGVETLTAPIGSYKYVDYNTPINSYVQFQQQVATITCKVYGLPMIPPAANMFAGAVNHKAFTVFLDQEDEEFTFAAETLLFQPPAVEFGFNPDLSVSYNMIYRFIYRPQKHNYFFYYPGGTSGSGSGSGSGAGLRWSWRRIALDTTSPTSDYSAPFCLRNMGYLWSPQVPPLGAV